MDKRFDKVYQFRITLKGIRPPIWRRIQVPETYTFWDLHVAIQDAMGWLDCHLHEFEVLDPSLGEKVDIGIPDKEYGWGKEVLPGWRRKIARYFSCINRWASYTYDFGDNWEHEVKLEKILPRDGDTVYPTCIKGKRACPPEDCGGVWGYEELLEAIGDPCHVDHEEMLEWVGEFDPEEFDVKNVRFDDPSERRKNMFL